MSSTLTDVNIEELNGLSEEERKIALDILKQLSETGESTTYNELLYSEYNEIPVDIDTFIDNDYYLGRAWKDSSGNSKMYPYWRNRLRELFPTNITTSVNNTIFSGSRGIGKTEIAIAISLYLMYRLMCLKNPKEHLHLKPTERICFAYMNITKALAEDIGVSKFQETVKASPWFMARGSMTRRNNDDYWIPPDYINIIIGSQPSHVIGLPIFFCLDGDTEILTTEGTYKIKDLVGKDMKVYSISDSGELVTSDVCHVEQTATTDEEYEICLEDGTVIKCTKNHRFMLKDGTYKEAQNLTVEDELADVTPFGYIYKYTNKVTGKIYIGKREKPVFDEFYWGSGKLWKEDLKKFGKEAIDREILCFGFSRKDLNELEKHYISMYNSTDRGVGYNIHKGGQGGNSVNDTELWSLIHSGCRNGRYHAEVSEETRRKISRANKGKVRSDDVKRKMSIALKGKKKPEGFSEMVSMHQRGRKKSESELKHLREALRIHAKEFIGSHIYNNGVVEKRVKHGEDAPDGFILGRLPRKKTSDNKKVPL